MKNKSIILGLVSAVFACNLVFTSCSEPKEVEKTTFLEKRIFTGEDSLIDTYPRTKGEAHSGNYFSRTDSVYQYGMGTYIQVNDTNINKDHRVYVNFWARTNIVDKRFSVAIALHDGDNVVFWQEVEASNYVKEPNKWVNIIDSVTVPASLVNKPGLILKTFAFNKNNQAKTIVYDCDDLEITYKTVIKVLEE
jgi:hypothetical protein